MDYGLMPGRYPAIVRSYNQARRTCRVEIPGLTDGADVLPEAEIEYPIGDKSRAGANTTEIEMLAGDTVWVAFLAGDPRYPIITGYVRSVQAGDKKLQFNIRVTEDGFVVRLTVGFSGGITGAAAEIGRTTDVGAAIAIADAEAAKRGAGDGQADPQKDADRALFQSVIDGTVPDILAPDLADTLEAAFNRNQDDPALVTLFEQAVATYQNAMLAATANLS